VSEISRCRKARAARAYKERRVAAMVDAFVFGGGEEVSSNDGAAITAALSLICLETDLFETVVVAVGIEEECC